MLELPVFLASRMIWERAVKVSLLPSLTNTNDNSSNGKVSRSSMVILSYLAGSGKVL